MDGVAGAAPATVTGHDPASAAADTVRLWLIRTDVAPDTLAGLACLLDADERDRAAAFGIELHRRRFIAFHGAARVILGELLGIPPGRLRWRHGKHGKPELANAPAGERVSLSHSADLAALALARHRRVGVDVQELAATLDPVRIAERFFPGAEARFVRAGGKAGQLGRFTSLWARKEACVKVTGGRLMQGMKLPVQGAGSVTVHDPAGGLPGPCLVRDAPAPAGFRAAVALEGTGPFRIRQHRWPAP
jgi:4'-phosphopantetheinyl transferase